MISERGTENVQWGGRAYLMHYSDLPATTEERGFFESVWPVSGLKFLIRPADWEVAVLPTQTRRSMHKRLAIKVYEEHGDKTHILWLSVVQKIGHGNALDILWFEDSVLRVGVWNWRVRDCLYLCWTL